MNVETPRRNLTGAVVPALAAAALAGVGALMIVGGQDAPTAPQAPRLCILENADGVGGPIELVDGNGSTVTQADFIGQPTIVYFGFTHCPDVCPNSMYAIAAALEQTDVDAQPILISVDPERDTPQRMREYAATDGFPEGLVGLTGSRAQVEAAQRSFQAYSARINITGAPPDVYNVDHSSMVYVLDAQWRTRAIMPTMTRADFNNPRSALAPVPPEQIAQCIAAGLARRD